MNEKIINGFTIRVEEQPGEETVAVFWEKEIKGKRCRGYINASKEMMESKPEEILNVLIFQAMQVEQEILKKGGS